MGVRCVVPKVSNFGAQESVPNLSSSFLAFAEKVSEICSSVLRRIKSGSKRIVTVS